MDKQALFEEALKDLESAIKALEEMTQVTHVTTTLEAAKSAQGKFKTIHDVMMKTAEPVEEKPADVPTPETVPSEKKPVGTTTN